MWIVLIIVAIIVIVLVSKNKSEPAENLDGISTELMQLLRDVIKFANSPYWKDECGLVMVIPVNDNGDMYRPDSKRLRVSILLYRDDIQSIKLFSQNEDITSRFELVQEDNNFSYMATTYCTFHNNYKTVMAALNERVQKEFPEAQLKFDGSRILANSVCK